MKKTLFVLLAVLAVPAVISAQVTRHELAEIRVGKEGNFKYWNEDSQTIESLKSFVGKVTDFNCKGYVPPEDRIATFDVDGTLLCETAPYYMNWMLCFYRYLHDDTYTPDPQDRALVREMEEYVLANHSNKSEWGYLQQELQAKAFRGLTQEEFEECVHRFLDNAEPQGLSNLTWGTALYWPMIEVVSYLVANDFKVFVCSGVDRDVCRVICRDVYDIPGYQIIASDVNYVLESQGASDEWTEMGTSEGYPYNPGERIERGDFKQLTTASNKIVSIRREIGQKPILAWGNSSGDYPMFYHTTLENRYPSIAFCLLCDDTTREFGNKEKADKCKAACQENGWVGVSMRDEWTTIYGPDVVRTEPTNVPAVSRGQADDLEYSINGTRLQHPRRNQVYIQGNTKRLK